ncbi:hypothetical protein [Variovorax sp.]|uniref:hypothetical protein n=1 Tax=Variovorax sp. TaxID=1871043 RepID=UPI0025E495FE|nr:hypothetical protein [Variovorax sp.]
MAGQHAQDHEDERKNGQKENHLSDHHEWESRRLIRFSSTLRARRAAPLRTSESASALVAPNMRGFEGLTRRPLAQNEAVKRFRSLVALDRVKTDRSIVIP